MGCTFDRHEKHCVCAHLFSVVADFKKLGTMQSVAAKHGVTKERIRQIICKYEQRFGKLERRRHPTAAEWAQRKLDWAQQEEERQQEALIQHEADLQRLDAGYAEITQTLGRHPSAFDLQVRLKTSHGWLRNLLKKEYGGLIQYRKAKGIPKPPHQYRTKHSGRKRLTFSAEGV